MIKIMLVVLTAFTFYCLFLLADKSPYNGDSFGSKKEWANLQSIGGNLGEVDILNKELSVMRFNGSQILVYQEKGKICGILLNCKYPPYYKSMGECSKPTLSDELLKTLKETTDITKTVEHILRSKV